MRGSRTPTDSATVGPHRHEDLRDIDRPTESIRKDAPANPGTVDANGELAAGLRRRMACHHLGWDEVPVTDLGELTPRQKRRVELAENLTRKDLTP